MSRKLLSLVLSLLLLLAGCSSQPQSQQPQSFTAQTEGRRVVPYEQMVYQHPEGEAYIELFDKLTAKAFAATDSDALYALYQESLALYESFSGQYDLAQLARYLNTKSEAAEEEFRYISDLEVDISNALADTWCALLENPHAQGLTDTLGDALTDDMRITVLLSDPSVSAYKKERAQLVIDYNQALSSLALEKNGVIHTPDNIQANTYDEYMAIYDELYRSNAEEFTAMLQRLIELDQLTAAALGFDSAADLYYASYARDYSPQQAMEICGYVKEHLSPLYQTVNAFIYYGGTDAEQAAFFKTFPKALTTVDKDLATTWNIMRENNLCDFTTRAEKQSGIAFCSTIEHYDAAFIFANWEDDFDSASTIIHEFGHFYNMYTHATENTVFNLDLAEFHSQGLEYLLHNQYADMVHDPLGINQLAALQSAYDTFLHQSLLEEMTQTLYSMDSFTAADVAALYRGLCSEYGYDDLGDGYQWYRITHLFDTPFYTISYTTSAAAAMQLWELSEQDWDGAVKAYLEVTQGEQNRSFGEAMHEAGLQQATEETLYESLAELYLKSFTAQS